MEVHPGWTVGCLMLIWGTWTQAKVTARSYLMKPREEWETPLNWTRAWESWTLQTIPGVACHPICDSGTVDLPRTFPKQIVLPASWRESTKFDIIKRHIMGLPGGSVVKNVSLNAGDMGLNPESGRCLGGGNGSPVQNSCLGNPMDRGTWWAVAHGVAKSRTRWAS